MIIQKLYLYDSSQEANGYKGIDYSSYIIQGGLSQENLDDTIDSYELTLQGLNVQEEFAPKTKFIWELYDIINNEEFHIIINNDTVTRPIISDETYFNHHLSFNGPEVDAQGRIVDNMSITYKLKDVSLEIPTSYNENTNISINETNVSFQSSENYGQWIKPFGYIEERRIGHKFEWVYPDWYTVNIDGVDIYPNNFDWDNFKYYQIITSGDSKLVEFPVPMLRIKNSIHDSVSLSKIGYASIDVVVEETDNNSGTITTIINKQINPSLDETEELWNVSSNNTDYDLSLNSGWIESRPSAERWLADTINIITKVSEFDATKQNRKISFEAKAGKSYNIYIKRHQFNPLTISGSRYANLHGLEYSKIYDINPAYYGYSRLQDIGFWIFIKNSSYDDYALTPLYPSILFSFLSLYEQNIYDILTKSAPTRNALHLFNKAVLLTNGYTKNSNTPVEDTLKPFYLLDSDVQNLKNTLIVENFYNKNNLWELFLDAGKYIHARPKFRFGSDNRYVVNWLKYGNTKINPSNSNKISIFNSRFVEEYISALSSYVTNMVQLGGEITEYIAPKSSSEDFLVYNDVAELIVSKPIIEIISVVAIDKNGVEKDITEFVYEENVYKLLPITVVADPTIYNSVSDFPETGVLNVIYMALDTGIYYTWDGIEYKAYSTTTYGEVSKGLAIYYKLGDNKLQGLTYRLPTVNTGAQENDYSIKRILGKVYGITGSSLTEIKVNDYIFKIRYRIKDTLRSTQVRPDLRSYLLSSKYDKFPQHNQFNNQEDILIDSVKFGNNNYGKLIRTGNTVITISEWNEQLSDCKKVGELYSISGDLYYVSKVKNVYYSSHIESEVEYSKNFNRLSQIIGIPSEPRFYEISEQSLINREKEFNDFIVIGTGELNTEEETYIRGNVGWQYIGDLLFGGEVYPKYVVTYFKNDIDTKDPKYPNREDFVKSICSPVSTYSLQNTLTLEWDMLDNFSAGNKIIPTSKEVEINNKDTAYSILSPVQYCDANGRADLVDFAIIKDYTFDRDSVLNLPENPIDISAFDVNYLYRENKDSDRHYSDQTFELSENSDGVYDSILYNNYSLDDNTGIYSTSNPVVAFEDLEVNKTYYKVPFDDNTKIMKYFIKIINGGSGLEFIGDFDRFGSGLSYIGDFLFGNQEKDEYGSNTNGEILLKDNREKLGFNFNLNAITDSHRYVLSAYMWQQNKSNIRLALLKEEVNKISNQTILDDIILIGDIGFDYSVFDNGIIVNIEDALSSYTSTQLEEVKAIAIYSINEENISSGEKYFVMARNVGELTDAQKREDWSLTRFNKNMFKHQ